MPMSRLIGASKPEQVIENVKTLTAPDFTQEELADIDRILLSRSRNAGMMSAFTEVMME